MVNFSCSTASCNLLIFTDVQKDWPFVNGLFMLNSTYINRPDKAFCIACM